MTPRVFYVKAKVSSTAVWLYLCSKAYTNRGFSTHYFPTFYGEFLGPYQSEGEKLSDDTQLRDFQLIYNSTDTHKSLITLTFTAETISFVENRYSDTRTQCAYYCRTRSQGRIVEALVNDFTALVGTGILTVVVQNTGLVTADYAVSCAPLITHCIWSSVDFH